MFLTLFLSPIESQKTEKLKNQKNTQKYHVAKNLSMLPCVSSRMYARNSLIPLKKLVTSRNEILLQKKNF